MPEANGATNNQILVEILREIHAIRLDMESTRNETERRLTALENQESSRSKKALSNLMTPHAIVKAFLGAGIGALIALEYLPVEQIGSIVLLLK